MAAFAMDTAKFCKFFQEIMRVKAVNNVRFYSRLNLMQISANQRARVACYSSYPWPIDSGLRRNEPYSPHIAFKL